MTKPKLIHIKLDYGEAVRARRDILSSEVNLISIAKHIRKYKLLRQREFLLKLELERKLKDFRNDSRKFRTTLPKLEIPKILKRHEEERKEEKEFEVATRSTEAPRKKTGKAKKEKPTLKKKESPEDSLEKELEEIQSRLRRLE